MPTIVMCMVLLMMVAFCHRAEAAEAEDEASRPYPVDVTQETLADPDELARLETPGEILLEEGFESADALGAFYNLREKDRGAQEVALDPELAHTGSGCLQLNTIDEGGDASDAGVTYWLGEGAETVYYRRYIYFPEDYDQGPLHHVGGSLYAVAGDDPHGGMGNAGRRPNGDDRFGAGFEPWRAWGQHDSPGAMSLYTYWMDMKVSRDGVHYYGNQFMPPEEKLVVPKRGVWICLEHMLASGTPGEADGEMAAWVDGVLYLHLKGFRWRTNADVRPKRISCGMYIHRSKKANVLYYDDLAASTGYVGPTK